MPLRERLSAMLAEHGRRGASFLVVGLAGAVIDLGAFNALVYWHGSGPMADHAVLAKSLATLVATVSTYFGNSLLTYADRDAPMTRGRTVVYLVLNVAAIGIQAGCLAFSRHVLGLHSQLSDNVFGTGMGVALSTVFRYVTYPRWVFPEVTPAPDAEDGDPLWHDAEQTSEEAS